MKLREVVDVIDLEQEVSVLIDGAEVYSGPLEEMSAGQLLTLEKNEVEKLKSEKAQIVFLKN